MGGPQGAFILRSDGTLTNGVGNAGLFSTSTLFDTPRAAADHLAALRLEASTVSAAGQGLEVESFTELLRGLAEEVSADAASAPPAGSSDALRLARKATELGDKDQFVAAFEGIPHRWDIPSAANPAATLERVPWNPETGPLGPGVSNAQAISTFGHMLDRWAEDPLNTLAHGEAASIGVDVDADCPGPTCYQNWWRVQDDGISPLLFDADGRIFEDLFGTRCSAAGLGGPQSFVFRRSEGRFYVGEGLVLHNGIYLSSDAVSVCGFSRPLTADEIDSTPLHEGGHMLGLGHVLVNEHLLEDGAEAHPFGRPRCDQAEVMGTSGVSPDCLPSNDVPILSERRTLESLYPSSASASAGVREVSGQVPVGPHSIVGRVLAPDGTTPADCINVIYRNVDDPFGDAGAAITGSRNGPGDFQSTLQGFFEMNNLDADARYVLEITPLSPGGSWPGLCSPLPDPEPVAEFWNGFESGRASEDDPACFTPLAPEGRADVDIVLNDRAQSQASCDCRDDEDTLCLGKGKRFRLTGSWKTAAGEAGTAMVERITNDTGYLWFFDEANVEAVVKVLDACAIADRFWVFAGGLTDTEVEIIVEDTETGDVQRYHNPLGVSFQPIQDTGAFAGCPTG